MSENDVIDFIDEVTVFRCKFCAFICAWKSGLSSHIRSFHSKQIQNGVATVVKKPSQPPKSDIFLCSECKVGFTSLEECKRHMSKLHKIGPAPLALQPPPLTPPDKQIAPPPVEVELNPCTTITSTKQQKFKCAECKCQFKSEPNLNIHLNCHGDNNNFICTECEQESVAWRPMAIHLWKAHGIDLDLFACDVCEYKSHAQSLLASHKKIHSPDSNFSCTICDKSFKQSGQLRNHLLRHTKTDQPESRLTCDICQRTFSNSKCLTVHHKAVHSNHRPFVCPICGHATPRKSQLQSHVRLHTKEKPFECDKCHYKTADHNSLRRHKMRHEGTTLYNCQHCDYSCIQAISLKHHVKKKHPGLSGISECGLCQFRSVNSDKLANHMRDHERGVLPITSNVLNDGCHDIETTAPLDLPDDTLQQLETMLPGNEIAAQLIFSCLNALSTEGGVANLPPGVTTTSSTDGTQTITIQLPQQDELNLMDMDL